jgi:hypothetical protein
MTKRNTLKHALACLGALSLTACGGGDKNGTQDVGTPRNETNTSVLAARVVDGYLAGATVYADLNDNGKLDAFEPRALTDADGYFSYNHETGTDYCAANAPAEYEKHCLRASIAPNTNVVIRATGGYDTATKLPFEGTLAVRANDLDPQNQRFITPYTSLIANAPAAVQSKLTELGIIPANPTQYDPIISGNIGYIFNSQILQSIGRLQGLAFDAIAKALNMSTSESHFEAYTGISQFFAAKDFSSSGATLLCLDSVDDHLDILERQLSNQGISGLSLSVFTAQAIGYLEGAAKVGSMCRDLQESFANLDVPNFAPVGKASQTLLATVGERLAQNPRDQVAEKMMAWANAQFQGNTVSSDFIDLGNSDIDPSALTDPDFDFDPATDSLSTYAKIPPEAAWLLGGLINTSFGVSLNDDDQQGAALFYITGDNGARSGNIDICVRYRDDSGDFDTGSASDPNGALLVNGHWSLVDDHTLALSVDIVGGIRSMLIKSVGVDGLDREYRFNFGSNFSKWRGTAPAAFAVGNKPKSDAECKTALIESFGQM